MGPDRQRILRNFSRNPKLGSGRADLRGMDIMNWTGRTLYSSSAPSIFSATRTSVRQADALLVRATAVIERSRMERRIALAQKVVL